MAEGSWTQGGRPVVVIAADAGFNEQDHPRAENGQFGSGGGGSSSGAKGPTPRAPGKSLAQIHRDKADRYREEYEQAQFDGNKKAAEAAYAKFKDSDEQARYYANLPHPK